MEEYIGPTDSVPTEEVPLFEPPANEATNEKNLSSEDRKDLTGSQRYCAFCFGRVSLDDPTVYHEVRTWVRGPKKDSSVLREYTGLVACGDCIAKLRSGVGPNTPDFETALESPEEPVTDPGVIFTDRSEQWRRGYDIGYSGLDLTPDVAVREDEELREGWLHGCEARDMNIINRSLGGSNEQEN